MSCVKTYVNLHLEVVLFANIVKAKGQVEFVFILSEIIENFQTSSIPHCTRVNKFI